MTTEKCRECRYWEQEDQLKDTGFCRRYAPRSQNINPVDVGSSIDALWPRTNGNDWCGEYSERI